MAFKRAVSDRFPVPVTVKVPNEKGGFDVSTFSATFLRPTANQRPELAALSHEDLVRRQVVDWDLVDDETKEKVPFSTVELEVVLQILPTPLAMVQAFWDTLNGVRTKN